MKAIIIEDEQIAAQNLQRLIKELDPNIEVSRVLQSVEESIEYFSHANNMDIVFMDIHLADGLAFHIFDSVEIKCPVIFTTAFDQYALDAFKVNSIDYLLKPINKKDLQRALEKHRLFIGHQRPASNTPSSEQFNALMEMMRHRKYKSHFLIPVRDKLIPLNVNDIAYIVLFDKISRVVTYDNSSYCIDKPLDAIFTQLDPSRFFRANRQFIIAHDAVDSIVLWPLSKLFVSLKVPTPEKIIISRARVSEFKEWFTE